MTQVRVGTCLPAVHWFNVTYSVPREITGGASDGEGTMTTLVEGDESKVMLSGNFRIGDSYYVIVTPSNIFGSGTSRQIDFSKL